MQWKICRTPVRIWPASFALASSTSRYDSKKKTHNDFFVQGGKTSPAAPNAFFSALVCNDALNNSGSVFFFPPPAERHPQNADKTSGRAATACLARFCLPRELWRHRRAGRSLCPCAASRAPLSSARSASPGGQWLCRYAVAPLPRTASSASSSNCAFSTGPESSLPTVLPPPKRPRSPDTGASAAPRLRQVQERS